MRTTKLAFAIATLLAPVSAAHALTYNWLTWTAPTATTAQAFASGLGAIGLSVSGPGTGTSVSQTQFVGAPFTPTTANSTRLEHRARGTSWSFTIDLSAVTNTQGLIIGIGNMGHGDTALPGYRFAATSTSDATIAPSGFIQVGSFDHFRPGDPAFYNDDVSLNVDASEFDYATTPGGNDINSDVLLLSLPAQVKNILIQSNGAMGQDAVDVLVAVSAVPEPETYSLLAAGLLLLIRGRKQHRAR